jgi:hypothetical protein
MITTHICPNAPIQPHKPVAFMGFPVDTIDLLKYEVDIRDAVAFCLEVAKAFTEKKGRFYDEDEFSRIVGRYGRMNVLQTLGKE